MSTTETPLILRPSAATFSQRIIAAAIILLFFYYAAGVVITLSLVHAPRLFPRSRR